MNCILCKVCYYLGDRWSKLVDLVPDSWDWFGSVMIEPYHVLMQWSVDLDVRGKCGVWRFAGNGTARND